MPRTPDPAYQEALRRIKRCRSKREDTLHLSGLGLATLPPEIGQLTDLRGLYLRSNQLRKLPPEIGQLTALTELHLGGNQLAILPPEIGNLAALKVLGVGDNQLTRLPPEIGKLTALTELYFGNNQLTALPPEIGKLTALESLLLGINQLTTLPPEIGNLAALKVLYLGDNQLTTLPPEIGKLLTLKKLYLGNNQLTMLPSEIGELSALRKLYLGNNQLKTLPSEIGKLSALTRLYPGNNQLTTLPPEIGQLTALTGLSLRNNLLTTLPSEIGNLKALTEFSLGHNHLTTVPPTIGRLTALTRLYLGNNQLTTVPPAVGQLTALTELDLGNNRLTTLPLELGKLTVLTTLDLRNNQLKTLLPEIGQLSALTWLHLGNNQLTETPAEIGELTALTELFLGNNELTALPPAIGKLTALTRLYLQENLIVRLPESVGRLKKLKHMILEDNILTELPRSLTGLRSLKVLTLHENDALGLPSELLGPRWYEVENKSPANPQDILRFYFAQRGGTKRPLNEVKVLVVGESEVGKTSIIRQLRGEKYNPKEDKTHGIERHQVTMRCDRLGDVRLNVWDFGGQDIMHATHQFFLSHRSVYLLVLDSRQNERQSRIDYWLRLIASFGGTSPVIVVCNKADQQVMQLNWTGLQREYPQIRGWAKEVCCFHDEGEDRRRGLDELKQMIALTVANHLTEVDRPILTSWLDFKDQLEGDERPFLTLEEYHAAGMSHGIADQRDREVLLTLMHHLGSVLHFSEHAIFERDRDNNATPAHVEELNVLDPDWVTAAIYKLLNDAELIRAGGVLDRGSMRRSLAELPGDRYPASKEDFILAMMRRFEICFAFDGETERWLLPDLLNKDEVDTGDWEGSLRFRYQYRVLPGSVIGRLMVRLHSHIARHCLWRTGAKFKSGNCEALVRTVPEDMPPRLEIFIRGGKIRERREFLALLRGTLEDIHRSFSDNLGVEQLVEVKGHPGVFVDFERLLLKIRKDPAAKDDIKVAGKLEEFKIADTLNLYFVDRSIHVGGSVNKSQLAQEITKSKNKQIDPKETERPDDDEEG